MLRAKEREVERLMKELLEKNELLKKYSCEIEELRGDVKGKCTKYRNLLKQFKTAQNECSKLSEDGIEEDCCEDDIDNLEELLSTLVENIDEQRKEVTNQCQNVEGQLKSLATEKKNYLKERNEVISQLQCLKSENDRLLREVNTQKKSSCDEKEQLLKTVDVLKSENKDLLDKVNLLRENIQELNINFKETRWALTSEVAEKHDQVQELKKCVGMLEEQLRQANMQTHFKDDIIKELRKELKSTRKSERREFYDVVNEARERKSECASKVSFKSAGEVNFDTNRSESSVKCLDVGYHSASSFASKKSRDDNINVNQISDIPKIIGCVMFKIDEVLRDFSAKHSCEVYDLRALIDAEMEKICSVKSDLEVIKSKIQLSKCNDQLKKELPHAVKCTSEPKVLPSSKCDLVHLLDLEKFRDIAVTGVVTLEQMKEQIQILENLIKKYIEEYPCDCDKFLVDKCEEKLEKLHSEFDEITDQLCCSLQKFNKPTSDESFDSLSCDDLDIMGTQTNDSVVRLRCEYQRLQKLVCDQENEAEKLSEMTKELEEKVQQKRCQLVAHTRELDSKMWEVSKLRELIRRVCQRLKELQLGKVEQTEEKQGFFSEKDFSNLSGLFCDLKELWVLLEGAINGAFEEPTKLKDENSKLKEKLGCLEKCVGNKEETLRFLQDTVKMRECQLEELKSKMQLSESQSTQLAQDVEEKCKLIASLQEAIRKCKQFEIDAGLIEKLRFEYCELDCKLQKYEKEILLKNQKMKSLRTEVKNLTSENAFLTEKIKILDPKLKIIYKTCHLFEKTVNDLQEELSSRESEIEGLYEKIRDLENELEVEFKKCEDRALEDSKCIENLNATLRNLQNELYFAKEDHNLSVEETECRLRKEMEMRESELNDTIYLLTSEIKKLHCEAQEMLDRNKNSPPCCESENAISQAESQQQIYEKKMQELNKVLKCVTEEHEKERQNILEKLREEKKANVKNKSEITQLNERIKRKTMNEKTLKACIQKIAECNDNLKIENQDLKVEVEARKKAMCGVESGGEINLFELEELICSLKIQKTDLKVRCSNLKAEIDKEGKLKCLLKCREDEINSMMTQLNEMIENYKNTSERIQQTCATMEELEESLNESGLNTEVCPNLSESEKCEKLNNLLLLKSAENAKLVCQVEVLMVDFESLQSETEALLSIKDSVISTLQNEIECLVSDLQEFQLRCQKLTEENESFHNRLVCLTDKESSLQNEFEEKQKNLCKKLKSTIVEKNDLLYSLDEMQKQLEDICMENENKEKLNRELSEECSRLRVNSGADDHVMRNKTDQIICNLSNELKNLHCELASVKESYNILSEDYKALHEQLKCCEKKKANLERLYIDVNNENKELQELRAKYEKELCELKTLNVLLKEKIANREDESKNTEGKKRLIELAGKLRNLEKKIIPELKQEISEKDCFIESLKMELKEANICSLRVKNEALRMIQHTKKYLSAQRCANNSLKTRLETSNKRKTVLGAENRELEEQLKTVTQMNDFLLSQLESSKHCVGEVEPRMYSPLPWSCSLVERDTSSSEYLAESGFQSMQPSPTNLDHNEIHYDYKKNCPQVYVGMKKHIKYGDPVEYHPLRSGVR